MDVKEAVKAAKRIVLDTFDPDEVGEVGLEEVVSDPDGQWRITIGFTRPWDAKRGVGKILQHAQRRTYKVVTLDRDSGTMISITNRLREDA
jgi:hypothetical protein